MKRPQKLAVMLVPTPPYEICGLIGSERLEEARDVLSVSLREFPASGDLLYLVGYLAFMDGDFAEAEKQFAAADVSPSRRGARFEVGLCRLTQNESWLQELLTTDIASIPPVEYMQAERRFELELGDPEVVKAWDDVIRNFGNLEEPIPDESEIRQDSIEGEVITIEAGVSTADRIEMRE